MSGAANPISRVLIVAAFVAVASSAGLQWVSVSAQAEAARQASSRQTLAEFSTLLTQYESTAAPERTALEQDLAGKAEQLTRKVRSEPLAAASRRVAALASYEASGDRELQSRLRAEVRGLMSQAENLESAALGRAELLATVNAILMATAAVLCGLAVLQVRRVRAEV